jgi:hypothetical protein
MILLSRRCTRALRTGLVRLLLMVLVTGMWVGTRRRRADGLWIKVRGECLTHRGKRLGFCRWIGGVIRPHLQLRRRTADE